ncbi:MAG: type IV pilin protein [Casimicrobiaceae bacterium]
MTNRPRNVRGFTLIEMLIVVVLVGVLAAIALPSYFQYVQRSKIIEATTGLSNMRAKFEQFFLDNRTYVGACAQYQPNIQAQIKAFVLACDAPAATATTYTLTATGDATNAMDPSFVYTVNEQDVKTSAGPYGSSGTCWVTRHDGSCG